MSVIKEEYLSDKVSRYDLLPISFLKKSAYTGSRDDLRYKIEKAESGEEPDVVRLLRVFTWTTPFAFDQTPAEEIMVKDFPFEEGSLDLIVEYLNGLLEETGK